MARYLDGELKRIMSHNIRVAEADGTLSRYPLSVATVSISDEGDWHLIDIKPFTKEEEGIEFTDFPPILVRM